MLLRVLLCSRQPELTESRACYRKFTLSGDRRDSLPARIRNFSCFCSVDEGKSTHKLASKTKVYPRSRSFASAVTFGTSLLMPSEATITLFVSAGELLRMRAAASGSVLGFCGVISPSADHPSIPQIRPELHLTPR